MGVWGDEKEQAAEMGAKPDQVVDSSRDPWLGGEQPQPSANGTEPPPIDVAATMGDATGEPKPPPGPEVFSAPVEGQPTDGTQGKKQRRSRAKAPDPLGEMLKQCNFGSMAVLSHQLMYHAIDQGNDGRKCPPLLVPEAQLVEQGTNAYVRHLLETNAGAVAITPLAYFMAVNLIPIVNRAPPIVEASIPLMQRVWEGLARFGAWVSSLIPWGRHASNSNQRKGTESPK